jgi:hypothetical protein
MPSGITQSSETSWCSSLGCTTLQDIATALVNSRIQEQVTYTAGWQCCISVFIRGNQSQLERRLGKSAAPSTFCPFLRSSPSSQGSERRGHLSGAGGWESFPFAPSEGREGDGVVGGSLWCLCAFGLSLWNAPPNLLPAQGLPSSEAFLSRLFQLHFEQFPSALTSFTVFTFYSILFFAVLGIELRALYVLSNPSTTELYPPSRYSPFYSLGDTFLFLFEARMGSSHLHPVPNRHSSRGLNLD